MKRKIVIVGGGISGLALLHYLTQRGGKDEIVLLEKNDYLGGTIGSQKKGNCLFEAGPSGFLDSKPRTLEFIKELGLKSSLVRAGEAAKTRFLSVGRALHSLPTSPKSFLFSDLLSPLEKARILGEFFVPRGRDPGETVYDFGKRRFGEKFARVFLDPMVSGVFGGDARRTNLKAAFPRIYWLEQEHGSLFKALIRLRKAKKAAGRPGHRQAVGSPTGTLTSLRGGLAEMIGALERRYSENIVFNAQAETVFFKEGRYEVFCDGNQNYTADRLFLCVPAYSAAVILKEIDGELSSALGNIPYAPMAVLGLVFPAGRFPQKPEGYGYLIPSSEKKDVLGVLFESDVFPGRCREDQVLFRVMIGGARHPEVLAKTEEELTAIALDEINETMGTAGEAVEPQELFFVRLKEAIPQYDQAYCEALETIERRLVKNPGLHLSANYLKGVALNDCVENAFIAAQKAFLP